jgi:hypothetical protein
MPDATATLSESILFPFAMSIRTGRARART